MFGWLVFVLGALLQGSWAGAVEYSYDSLNRLIGAQYSADAQVTYSYDAAGNLTIVSAQTALVTHAITTAANPPGSGTVSCTPNPVPEAGASTCSATANAGYAFSAWSGDCTGATCSLSNVTSAKNVTAGFALNNATYVITATPSPAEGGTVACTPNPVNSGGASTCTATPASGYSFSAFSGDCSGATCVLSNVTSTKNVTAGFAANSYNVSTDAVANGSISPTVQTVNHGASASFTVTPNSGYGIASATGCGGGVSGKTYTTGPITASCTVTVVLSATPINGACGTDSGPTSRTGAPLNLCTTGTASLVYGSAPWNWTCAGSNGGSSANCSAAVTSYAVTASAGTGGTISPTSRTVAHNGVTTFTVSPSAGYAIGSVSGCSGSLSGTLYTTGAVTANCAVTASFTATNTTTAIGTVSPSPSKIGQSVAIAYTVSNPGSGGDTVTIKDGADSTLCTGTVTAGTCNATFSSSGAKTLIAHYTPSGAAQASASPGKNHLVADSPALVTPSLPSGVVGVSYATQLVASGGVPPYSFTTTGLPAGFSLSTSGLLSGTASAVAAPTVTITVTDSLSQSASKDYTLSLVAQLTVATTSLPEGLVNAPYDQTLLAVGGKTPYVWSVTAGTLPDGLTLTAATGQLSGTPSNLGTSADFTVQVQDANARTSTQLLSLSTQPPTVTKTGSGTASGTTLSANLAPSNGGSTCMLDDSQTRVVTLADIGALSAPPNSTLPYGLFKMTVQGCTPGQTQLNLKLVYPAALPPGTQYWKYGKTAADTSDHWYVLPSAVITGNTVSFSITDGGLGDDDLTADGSITDPGVPGLPTLAIGGTPGSGQVGSGYGATLTPSGGTGPYNWSIDSGGLPAGVTLNATTGQFSGTPTTAGTFNFSVKLVDTSDSASKTQAFAVTIASAPVDPGNPPTPVSDTTPDPFSFIDVLKQPLGTSLESNTITVRGIDSGAYLSISGGEYRIGSGTWSSGAGWVTNGQTVTLRHTTATTAGGTVNTTLTIGGVSDTFSSTTLNKQPPTLGSVPAQNGLLGVAFSLALASYVTPTDGDPIVSYALASGTLPPGVSLNSTSGLLSGTPTTAGRYTASVTASDRDGASNAAALSFTIDSTTPAPFAFLPQNDVPRSTVVTSNTITVAGLTLPVPISVSNGLYSLNGAAFTAMAGTLNNGASVRLQLTSSASYASTATAMLSIGRGSGNFTVSTHAAGMPDAFTFTPVFGAALSTSYTSNSVTLTGFDGPLTLAVSGGEYALNGGTYTSLAGNVRAGDTVTLRGLSSAQRGGRTSVVLTVGEMSGRFNIRTKGGFMPWLPVLLE
jgi:hypothetical protein